MKIRSLEFVGSLAAPDGPRPTDLPQVAFSGRSNVGKSSLINTILQRTRSKIAHVSSTPGKTQMVNFFRVNDRFYLVDLPGFGYARVPKAVQAQWKALIEGYVGGPEGPVGVVHLVDVRRGPTELDLQMLEYLAGLGLPTLIAVTKVDKLKRQERTKALAGIRGTLGLDEEQVIPFSSKTGEGRDALLGALDHLLDGPEDES